MKNLCDKISAIALLLFCGWAWWMTKSLPSGIRDSLGVTFFPQLMIILVAGLSLGLLARSFIGRDKMEKNPFPSKGVLGRMALFLLLLIGYCMLYEPLGFILSSAVALPLGMLLLGERRLVHVVVVPWAVILVAYLGFTKLMKVFLPGLPFSF